MKKSAWITISLISVLMSVILSLYLFQNIENKRRIILRKTTGEKIELNSKQNKFNILLILTNKEQCHIGVNNSFVKRLIKENHNRANIFFVVRRQEKKYAKKIQKKYKLNNIYYDLHNCLLLRLGGFVPSVILVDNIGNILFYSPVFNDIKMNSALVSRIKKITSFSIINKR